VQRFVFVVAAAGCGGAGALLAISQLNVEPAAAFSVPFSAQMIFATIMAREEGRAPLRLPSW
jgi:branched-chain amino acid transport system permease protein